MNTGCGPSLYSKKSQPISASEMKLPEIDTEENYTEGSLWAFKLLEQATVDMPKVTDQKMAAQIGFKYAKAYWDEIDFPTKGKTEVVKGKRVAIRTATEAKQVAECGSKLQRMIYDLMYRSIESDKWYTDHWSDTLRMCSIELVETVNKVEKDAGLEESGGWFDPRNAALYKQ
jgi:hypothetical protein